MKKKYTLLLLTNRDSDNVGDQVIEACDIALIRTAMANLGISEKDYTIDSRAASSVGTKYLQTKNKLLIAFGSRFMTGPMHKTVKQSDMIIFGGAPIFNYKYQPFYERTASTIELAQKYHKPVIFSGIGIEHYEEDNLKCQRLKKALNLDCVRQITTRDGIEELAKYKTNEKLVIDRVSDPAVFSAEIFRNYIAPSEETEKKTVGIFVFRANGFTDNNIDFTKDDAIQMWKDMISALEEKGYDYRLLTSGHFGDEAFMDYMIAEHGIREDKCIFNMNSPEKLISAISSFDAIVSCRLHPSIIAFSLNVPSVGLIWNPKVRQFYDCVGYPDRRLEVTEMSAHDIIEKIDTIMDEDIEKDKEYFMSVYRHLFYGIKKALELDEMKTKPYSYEELAKNIPAYEAVSEKESQKRLERKFRRMYKTLNTRAEINTQLKNELKDMQEMTHAYEMRYYSWSRAAAAGLREKWERHLDGTLTRKTAQVLEITCNKKIANDGHSKFASCPYQHNTKDFSGWRIRFQIGDAWFWYLEDGSFCSKETYSRSINHPIKMFSPGDSIPLLPLIGISTVMAEAQWKAN